MSKFKVGDQVYVSNTGTGVITREHGRFENIWWIKFDDIPNELWANERSMKLISLQPELIIEVGKTYVDNEDCKHNIVYKLKSGMFVGIADNENEDIRRFHSNGIGGIILVREYDWISELKIDDPVMTINGVRHFAGIHDGSPYYWVDGKTSFTTAAKGRDDCIRPYKPE